MRHARRPGPLLLAAALVLATGAAPATPDTPGTGGLTPWRSGTGCRALAPPTGRVIDVTPRDAPRLGAIVAAAPAGSTVRLADGTYVVTGGYEERLRVVHAGVTLRGRSADPAKVVIDGGYSIGALVHVFADDVTITDLTLKRAEDHLVHVYPRAGRDGITGLRLHRLDLVDSGEQFVKINSNEGRSAWVDRGRVTCSRFRMTPTGRRHVERAYGCYTGGIDAHGARDWVVRSNSFNGIFCDDGEVAEHAVHFWKGSRGTIVENNAIRNCSRGIGFGLVESGEARTYADDPYPGVGFLDHVGGVIRNNVIFADVPQYDTGIELAQARGVRVLHNTIIETRRATRAYSSIDYRFGHTVVEIRNNLTRRITVRDGARAYASRNVQDTPRSWFRDGGRGDAHLNLRATGALGRASRHRSSGYDLDGTPHDQGRPDIGADEWRPGG